MLFQLARKSTVTEHSIINKHKEPTTTSWWCILYIVLNTRFAWDLVYSVEKSLLQHFTIVHAVIYHHRRCPVLSHYHHLLVVLTQPVVGLIVLLENVSAARLLPPGWLLPLLHQLLLPLDVEVHLQLVPDLVWFLYHPGKSVEEEKRKGGGDWVTKEAKDGRVTILYSTCVLKSSNSKSMDADFSVYTQACAVQNTSDVSVLLRRLQLHHANLEASETQKFRCTVYIYNFAAHHHAIHNIAMNEVELLTAMLNDGRRDRKNNEK